MFLTTLPIPATSSSLFHVIHVLSMSANIEMSRFHTKTIVTVMTDFHTFRYFDTT